MLALMIELHCALQLVWIVADNQSNNSVLLIVCNIWIWCCSMQTDGRIVCSI